MIKLFNDAGEEVEAYSKDEYEAISKSVAEKDAKIAEQAQQLSGQRHEMKRLSEMTEEEKTKYLDGMTKAQRDLALQTEELQRERQSRIDTQRNQLFQKYAGKDEALKEKLKTNYGLLNVPDETPEQMEARVRFAYGMVNVENEPSTGFGLSGASEEGGRSKNGDFASTERGKAMEEALFGGIIQDNANA